MRLLDAASRGAVKFLGKWFFFSVVSGLLAAGLVRLFLMLLHTIRDYLAGTGVIPPVWALLGALLAGLLVYRVSPGSIGEGIPSYLNGMLHHRGVLGFRETIFKFWAALVTLTTFGSGGIVGPLGRVSAGALSEMNRWLRKVVPLFTAGDTHTAALCGFAATVGAIFHAPI